MPTFECVALDCRDTFALARFYGELLGWQIRADSEQRWVTLQNPDGGPNICFQHDPQFQPPTWPSPQRHQMEHLDFQVDDMVAERDRVLALGATLLDDSKQAFWVYADPAGHPFCLVR